MGSEATRFGPGNQMGRRSSRALSTHVRELCDNDPKVFLSVLAGVALDARARDGDRIAATKELLDRGWGKAVSLVLIDETGPSSSLDVAIRELLDEIRGNNNELVVSDHPVLESGEAA